MGINVFSIIVVIAYSVFIHMCPVTCNTQRFTCVYSSFNRGLELIENQCRATILTNRSFDACNNVKNIEIVCDAHHGRSLRIDSRAFVSVKNTLQSVILQHYNIKDLPERLFCGFDKLSKLSLKYNAIKNINNIGFGSECGDEDGAPSVMRRLEIDGNEIQLLRNNTFIRLQNLKYLDLSNNHLTQIEVEAFNGLKNLSRLDLSSNFLTTLPANVFENISYIEVLNLNSNKLKNAGLPNFQYFYGPLHLRLDSNLIQEVNEKNLKITDARSLDLSNNPIEIQEDSFQSFYNLNKLTLANVNLSNIACNTFSNLTYLNTLNVSNNKLKGIEKGLFRNCQVINLYLSGNIMKVIPDLNTSHIDRLVRLSLSHNQIINISNICISIPATFLTYLDLSFNFIEKINVGLLDCYIFLEVLILSHNSIKIIESPSHLGGILLKMLYLDHNQLTSVEANTIACSWCDTVSISYNNISSFTFDIISPHVKVLNLSHNVINNNGITLNFLRNYNDVRLTNKIEDFPQCRTCKPPSSLVLDISFNNLKRLQRTHIPLQVTDLYVNNNQIEYVESNFFRFQQVDFIKSIFLHNNQLRRLCLTEAPSKPLTVTLKDNPLKCSCELGRILFSTLDKWPFLSVEDLSDVKCISRFPTLATDYQSISSLNREEILLCKSTYQNSRSCECYQSIFRDIKCYFQCPSPCSCYHNTDTSFAIIGCSERNLTSVPVINLNVSTIDVYLNSNAITFINESSFELQPGIQQLFLNDNHLEYIHPSAFKRLQNLQVLSLTGNRLLTIHHELFKPLSNLRHLDLAKNNLSAISVETILPLKKLEVLKLSNNFLCQFPVWELNTLSRLQFIFVDNNSWSCDCDFVKEFRKWVTENSNIVQNVNNIFCQTEFEGLRNMVTYNFSKCYESEIPVLVTTTSIWVSVVVVICFLALVVGLFFYYRREVQVAIYSRYGVRIFNTNDDNDTVGNKIFDVFVAYSGDDEEFVVYELLPGLENIDKPYKTCVHNRDFLAGGYITENIIEAVDKSRRTLIVLTENFVKSEWCRFEFKTAHGQMLRDQRNRVIVVVINEVPKNVDAEIDLYLRTKTYLKWGDRLFWKRLYYVLPDRL